MNATPGKNMDDVYQRLDDDAKRARYLGRFGAWVHRYFESARMKHCHQVDEEGHHYVVGDGAVVLRVIKPHRRSAHGGVWRIEPQCYADYFLPEELSN